MDNYHDEDFPDDELDDDDGPIDDEQPEFDDDGPIGYADDEADRWHANRDRTASQ